MRKHFLILKLITILGLYANISLAFSVVTEIRFENNFANDLECEPRAFILHKDNEAKLKSKLWLVNNEINFQAYYEGQFVWVRGQTKFEKNYLGKLEKVLLVSSIESVD